VLMARPSQVIDTSSSVGGGACLTASASSSKVRASSALSSWSWWLALITPFSLQLSGAREAGDDDEDGETFPKRGAQPHVCVYCVVWLE